MKLSDALKIMVPVVAVFTVGMCIRDARQHGRERTSAPTHSAEPLGIYAPRAPGLSRADALAALEADARYRQARFTDAARPGYLWASSRVEMAEVAAMSPARLYEVGAQLFHYRFGPAEGFGDREQAIPLRVHRGRHGGPDAYTCNDCHRRGGPAGAGSAADNAYLEGDGQRPEAALVRNPPALAGAGVLELLAAEISRDLRALRTEATRKAEATGQVQRVELTSKGIAFGALTAGPDGSVDNREVKGVDPDLLVKPFGWSGHTVSLRAMVEDQLQIHHGMQTEHLAGEGDVARVGSFGGDDPDGDGVVREITEGQLTALTMYLAMQELPQFDAPKDGRFLLKWAEGKERFEKLGCANCHVPAVTLERAVYRLPGRDGHPDITVDLSEDGAAPRLDEASEGGGFRVYLFSDLKRHVVGPNLRDVRAHRGVSPAAFMTPPLWGSSRSGPYMHDGRAPTLEEAIMAHSGEATESQRAYAELDDETKGAVRVYINALTRAARFEAR